LPYALCLTNRAHKALTFKHFYGTLVYGQYRYYKRLERKGNMQSDLTKKVATRTAIYARTAVSQERHNDALASQIEQDKAHCQEHGYTVEETHIYSEECNGSTDYHTRSQLTALLKAAKRREFDIVVVSALDRLSRDYAQVEAIIEELQEYGVIIETIEGPVELAAMAMALLEKAEEEQRRRIAQRSRYAKAAKRQGESLS
jgi:DNA invertase Pin-like site-specific DNA recombinase